MRRRQRRWVAGLVMLGVVYAQIVTVAHACALTVPTLPGTATFAAPADATMPADCAAMVGPVVAKAKVCVAHCTHGQQIDVTPEAPVAAIPLQPALTVCIVSPLAGAPLDSSFLHARSTAPPVSLLYSRFLI